MDIAPSPRGTLLVAGAVRLITGHDMPRVNMRACDVSNLGDTYEIASPVGVISSGPRVSPRVFQLDTEFPSAKNRMEKAFCGGP